jgi:hypothetical protein
VEELVAASFVLSRDSLAMCRQRRLRLKRRTKICAASVLNVPAAFGSVLTRNLSVLLLLAYTVWSRAFFAKLRFANGTVRAYPLAAYGKLPSWGHYRNVSCHMKHSTFFSLGWFAMRTLSHQVAAYIWCYVMRGRSMYLHVRKT